MDIQLREATANDSESLWNLRNEPAARAASANPDVIPFEHHEAWFRTALLDKDLRIFLITTSESPAVGYVRFSRSEGSAEISISIDATARGKGIGTAAIAMATKLLLAEGWTEDVVAFVKKDNPSSLRAFENAGFVLTDEVLRRGVSFHELMAEGEA